MKKPILRKCGRKKGKISLKQNGQQVAATKTNSELLCDVCGKEYNTPEGLNQHKDTHFKFLRCDHCQQNFKTNKCLQRHQGDASNSPAQCSVASKLSCPKCQERFPCKGLLKNHHKCQRPKKNNSGLVSKKEAAWKKGIRRQKQVHLYKKESLHQLEANGSSKQMLKRQNDHKNSLLCEVCGKSLRSIKGLQRHKKSHQDSVIKTREHKCDECNKVFRTPSCLKLHNINHHGAKSSYQCKICKKHFLNNSRLAEHVRVAHTGEKIFICPRCKKGFTCSPYLKRHMLEPSCTPKEKYKCAECNKLCKSKYSLMYHVNTYHGNRPFRCKYCDRRYATKDNWQKHEAAHNGVYGAIPKKKVVKKVSLDFMCEQCGKAYGNKHLLARHQLLHTGEKPHICATCSKRFRCKSTLTEHERIHSGDKPFSCEHCGNKFRLSGHLRYHLKAVHKVTNIGRLKKIDPGKGVSNKIDTEQSTGDNEAILNHAGDDKSFITLYNKKQPSVAIKPVVN